jgi:photosystem II stability/assembly factor-like uncharacterized protein
MKHTLLSWFVAACAILSASCGDYEVNWKYVSQIQSAAFNGPDHLWLITSPNRRFVHTADGGSTWKDIESAIANLRYVSFIDKARGWSINRDGDIFRTTDAGTSWTPLAQLKSIDPDFVAPQGLQFVDDRHGWALEIYTLFCTQDGGITWKACFPVSNDQRNRPKPSTARFIDSRNGYICTEQGEIHKTANGGLSWDRKVLPGNTACRNVFFLDDNIGWSSSPPSSGIYRTEDGGNNWQLQMKSNERNNFDIESFHFVDKNNGWAVGLVLPKAVGSAASTGLVLRTTNGGANWVSVQVGTNETFFSEIHFIDPQHGWLISRDNVYRTEDGGLTWRIVLTFPPVTR